MTTITKTISQMLENLNKSTNNGNDFELGHGYEYEDVQNWIKQGTKESLQRVVDNAFGSCLMSNEEFHKLEDNDGVFVMTDDNGNEIHRLPQTEILY